MITFLYLSISCATFINTLGLVFDISGAFLLWRFGLPPNVSRLGASYLILEQTEPDEARRATRYEKLGKLGFVLLIIGFIFQIISNFV